MDAASETLQKTALHATHAALKARLVPFAGYEMPVQYSGVIEEHQAVRQNAGLFDVSHMGVGIVRGPDTVKFLNYALTRDLSKVQDGQAAYSLLCRANGGTVDDLIVYRKTADFFYAVLNASNKDKDVAYLRELSKGFDVVIEGPLPGMSLLALQGPRSEDVLRKLGFTSEWPKPFRFLETSLTASGKTIAVKLAFTGYTGEKGCEIFVEDKDVVTLWNAILSLDVKPIGLAARDTLRTEMGYSLYGHELLETINPVEAGLNWAVGFAKENFVGRDAIVKAKENPARKLIALKNDSRQAPRPDMRVFDATGTDVGYVTSGTFAPSLAHAIGLALVDAKSQAPYSVPS